MPRILIRSAKDPFLALSPEASLARNVFSSNSGNMLFGEAVHKMLSVPGTEVVSSGYVTDRVELSRLPETIEKINSEFDAFVIPLANAFRPSFRSQLRRLTRLIRRLDMPVVVVGVGAQTAAGAMELPEAERDVASKFLSAVLDRSAKVGVRGEITRRCLAALGFGDEHIEVIGCPSLYAHGRELTVIKNASGLTPDSPIAANLTLSQVNAAKIINRAAERYPNLVYVPQTIDELRMLLWGVPHSKPLDPEIPVRLDHPLYRQNRMRFFLDPIVWHQFLADREFAFGTRIHGNIAALSVGTPAHLLAFDSRTTELADYHAIPYASARTISPDTDPAELYDRADFDAFNARQPEAFDHYLRFLEKNDLSHIHQPGNENPGFTERLREINFPAGVGSPYVTGAEQTEQLLSRLRWLYQGPDIDRERSFGGYLPEPFGPLPDPETVAAYRQPPVKQPPTKAAVGLRGRVRRKVRRTARRLLA
ncbi:MAG TPA: polysaccharide pyruvyl transferase family protein [Microlunatus sp.]